MIKRVVVTTGLKARGYVDGRYVGEEKKESARGDDPRGARKVRGKAGVGKGRGKKRGAGLGNDNLGNTTGTKRRGRGKVQGAAGGAGNELMAGAAGIPGTRGKGRGQGAGQGQGQGRGPVPGKARKNRAGKRTPFRPAVGNAVAPSPSEVAEMRRFGEETRSGQFAEALAAQAIVKRERLHKVMAQSGLGSRRDMEIMISSGRVMVNGIVAGTGTQVSPGDKVMVDQRPVVLKFSEELPRVLLYHKPEGEIVTTDDPGNRITVFDNLPKVEHGKWIAIGRLDINTSGLLIFTTSGELANRFMHPRYEVEREYAVRILGALSEAQEQALLTGVNIDAERREDDDEDESFDQSDQTPVSPLARFDSIEKRDGEESDGANQWYHVTIKEGRNREVRKMFETQGLTVSRLIRTRFGKVELPPRLTRGNMVELSPDQVRGIVASAGMDDLFVGAAAPRPRGRDRAAGPGPVRPRHQGQVTGVAAAALDHEVGDDIGNAIGNAGGNAIGNVDGNAQGKGKTAGNARGERQPRNDETKRSRRNRRGGKNARRGPNTGAAPVGETAIAVGGGEDAGNRADAPLAGAGAVPGDAQGIAGDKPPNGPGRNPRGRSRRNFRGRNGRNRRGKGEPGNGNGNGGEQGGGGSDGGGGAGPVEGNS